MNIQWFPGHMTKAVRMMEENVALCNVLIYVIDARAVASCKNPVFDRLLNNKRVIYVFNKCDLVEKSDLDKWCKSFEAEGKTYVRAVGTSGECSQIVSAIKAIMSDVIDRYKAKGANKNIRAMVIGVPNSGKSTLINSMRKKASAITGDRPGVTRGKQWLALDSHIDLLDTPGTLWGKFENQTIAKHLAFIGSIRDDILDIADLAFEFVAEILKTYPDNLIERYSLESLVESPLEVLDQIAKARGFKLRGNEVDYDRTAKAIIDDFRKGRLGKIMLEKYERMILQNI
ncbi:MAG: ribosome biogenesis GTPase YlqF [Clostridia bacterium]|nr:ribosome biogenesis GTPase YlqF [Clostridia bacterium]